MANVVTKILTWAGFRVMTTWFAQYIQVKLIETLTKAQAIADSFSIINVGTQANVEEIVNAFADDHDAVTLTLVQQWPNEEVATEHTVYRHVMYVGGSAV